MSLSQTEQADYEAQFADLLGDLSTEGGDNANANAAVQNGDINVIATTETHAASKKTVSDGSEGITTVTATNTEMHKEKDGTTTTTTTRTITSNSSGDPETPQPGLTKYVDSWPPVSPAMRLDSRRCTDQPTSGEMPEGNAEQDAGKKDKDDKTGVDIMKARYTDKKEALGPKVIRKPKTLEHQWGKEKEEETPDKDLKIKLPQEQDLLAYTTLGADYGKQQYEKAVEKEKEAAQLIHSPISLDGDRLPVNRKVVEKVAPPEITKTVCSMFESGNLPDRHEIKKMSAKDDIAMTGGVYENEPEERADLSREGDEDTEVQAVQKGHTKNLLSQWQTKGQGDEKKPRAKINIHEGEGSVLENEPVQRSDVARESDATEQDVVLQKGHAKQIKDKWGSQKYTGPKERKPINLTEGGETAIVVENEPQRREDVMRGDDDMSDFSVESGKAKNMAGMWQTKHDDEQKEQPKGKGKPKACIELDRSAGPAVLENEPQQLEGVVRASDTPDSEKQIQIEAGRAKNIASSWQKQDDSAPKGRKAPIQLDRSDGPAVLENEPQMREGVIRSSDVPESEKSIQIKAGSTKSMATKWQSVDEEPKAKKAPIQIERGDGPTVMENEPAVLEGVIRSVDVTEDVIPGQSGRTRNMVSQFSRTEDDLEKKPRDKIVIERSEGAIVTENEPAPAREDVVRGDTLSQREHEVSSGSTRSMVGQWVNKEQDAAVPKTSTMAVAEGNKPRWVMEIEAARETVVIENEPEERSQEVMSETDVHVQESAPLIPENYAKSMKDVWNAKAAEEEQKVAENLPELVRFTPPREMTPPPLKNTQVVQSFQALTISQPAVSNGIPTNQQNGYPSVNPQSGCSDGTTGGTGGTGATGTGQRKKRQRGPAIGSPAAAQQMQKAAAASQQQQQHEQQLLQQQQQQQQLSPQPPPQQTVKSSTVLVFK